MLSFIKQREQLMRTITLRIKRVYFEAIKSGEKKIEYRDNTMFYRKFFVRGDAISNIVFHYQNPQDKIKVAVKEIYVIQKPDFLKDSKLVRTESVFAIQLGEVTAL